MNKKLMLLSSLAMMSFIFDESHHSTDKKTKIKDLDLKPKVHPIPKGCKKYIFTESFGTLEVIAINEKSALKKYNKWCKKIKDINRYTLMFSFADFNSFTPDSREIMPGFVF